MNGRELARVVVTQVSLHSAMTGCRLAAPLLALKQGYSASAVGVLLALFALAPLFLALPAGRMADRGGARLPLVLSALMAIVGAAAAALWPVFGMLCLAALLTGASASTALIVLQRHVGRAVAHPAELKTVFSWLGIAPAAANFLGPMLAGLLIDHAGPSPTHELGFRAAFAAMAVLPLLGWALALRLPGEPEAAGAAARSGAAEEAMTAGEVMPGEPLAAAAVAAAATTPLAAAPAAPERAAVRDSVWGLLALPMLRRLLFVNWLQALAWDVHTFVLPILGTERGLSASAIGALMAAFAVAAMLVRMALPRLTGRAAEWQIMLVCTLSAAATLVLYPWMPGALSMGACSVALGFALGAVQPMVLSLVHQTAPHGRQGEAMALRMMTINLSSLLMPMLFGSLGALIGVGGLFWLVGGVLGAGARAVPPLRAAGAAGSAAP